MLLILFVLLIILGAVFFFVYENDTDEEEVIPTVTAMEVIEDNTKDPVIVSRAYFTDSKEGSIGDFKGYSPRPEDNWLHRLPHEKP